jgi:hypothetical protein
MTGGSMRMSSSFLTPTIVTLLLTAAVAFLVTPSVRNRRPRSGRCGAPRYGIRPTALRAFLDFPFNSTLPPG